MRINEKVASVCFIFASVFMIAGHMAFASESVARIGGREYDDIDVALSDAGNGETIVLLDDVKTYELGAETVGESLILDRDLSFDLNGFTLEHGGTTVEIGEGRSLVFTDNSVTDKSAGGSLIFSDTDSEKSALSPQSGACLRIENINVISHGTAIDSRGSAELIEIKNSGISAGKYCVAAEAKTKNDFGIQIIIENSRLTAESDDGNNTAILINADGIVDIRSSEITGDRQALTVRSGKVNAYESAFKVTGRYHPTGRSKNYIEEKWGKGNDVPTGAVIAGNRNGNGYADTMITMDNCGIISENDGIPALYCDANKKYGSKTEITGETTVIYGEILKSAEQETAEISVTGGRFTEDITEYMDEEGILLKDRNGMIVVLDEAGFEDSGREFYIGDEEDLRLAEEYQADGVRWILTGSIDMDETIVLIKNITIAGGESVIRRTGGDPLIVVKSGAYPEIISGIFEGAIETEQGAGLNILGGRFKTDISEYINTESHIVREDTEGFTVTEAEEKEEENDKDNGKENIGEREDGETKNDNNEDMKDHKIKAERNGAGQHRYSLKEIDSADNNAGEIPEEHLTDSDGRRGLSNIGAHTEDTNTAYDPDRLMTRAMAAVMIWDRAGRPEPFGISPFLDVTSDKYYSKAVAWAYDSGIVAGYDARTYAPDETATKEQFIRMNDIANGRIPAAYVGVTDKATLGWAVDAME